MKRDMKTKERGFRAYEHEVRAILDGRQTQTRRIVKPQPIEEAFELGHFHKTCVDRQGNEYPSCDEYFGISGRDGDWSITCPFGEVGTRLWVRETWAVGNVYDNLPPSEICIDILQQEGYPKTKAPCGVRYPATDSISDGIRKRPSIHMPRWASRITLEIESIKVERLNDISDEDCFAEGCQVEFDSLMALQDFRNLWESIHGKDSFALNPFVWVIGFSKV